jgi:phosphoribosyl 1,2-cyclic phosphodiesterase
MKIKVWGARGSVAAPGPETTRYGGNTSCVQVTLRDGTVIVLDAGTGLRSLGLVLERAAKADRDGGAEIHILLSHLHLDHIQGLMFFAPCFSPGARIIVWGPPDECASLEERVGRYVSAPLSPLEVRELPGVASFRDCPTEEWTIAGARIRASPVTHRGPTLGFRITEGEESLCYLPDHEPALGMPLAQLEPEWISGFELACDATLLIHDCQYTDEEYAEHVGWGHSSLSDALVFARRTRAARVLLFHHDPLHGDTMLDRLRAEAMRLWATLGGADSAIDLAVERAELELGEGAAGWRPARADTAPLTTALGAGATVS